MYSYIHGGLQNNNKKQQQQNQQRADGRSKTWSPSVRQEGWQEAELERVQKKWGEGKFMEDFMIAKEPRAECKTDFWDRLGEGEINLLSSYSDLKHNRTT